MGNSELESFSISVLWSISDLLSVSYQSHSFGKGFISDLWDLRGLDRTLVFFPIPLCVCVCVVVFDDFDFYSWDVRLK